MPSGSPDRLFVHSADIFVNARSPLGIVTGAMFIILRHYESVRPPAWQSVSPYSQGTVLPCRYAPRNDVFLFLSVFSFYLFRAIL